MSGDEPGKEPLSAIFERLIANHGPISLMHFMGEANARYYASRDPLGDKGDFVTAPEISQMFGELIGLWLADMWIRAGREEPVHYVEIGPGRGTLARDALRAMKRYGLEPRPHFVETSTTLKDLQLATVPNAYWHHDLSTIPPYGPVFVVANEFLDALPVRQLVMTGDGWRERMVSFEKGQFVAIAGRTPMDAAVPEARREAPVGTLIETCPGAAATVYEVAGRLVEQGGAALFIDYGHEEERTGSTLQAVRAHRKVDAFASPGEADLTAHVDFATLAPIAQSRGCKWLGTVTQGRWLRELGIETRAENLSAFAPEHAAAIRSAKDRLIGEGQMGALFKVMGLAGPEWPDGVGF
ncbi:ATP synthase subunit beta [Novosphingobium marinum]|uniref:NADH dehydrogenase [ubiquinone] 1 alpha subcomplex assembly factor 7 n=1 Tax=Novosphingobium marinum TaxID=1514948 RepID=A0A7Z0BUX7_9SPHN|nr:SAM-dependent methyltransferase [Novosphingobium marinum]NYH94775.1 NADH dehydrogenase [ubiquinone] 1 alpha subcomplex assembly factor 7 [Novosphingobium marinum]GGC37404.1 ATP synthase subunit beta [Novosphingobium marinum]